MKATSPESLQHEEWFTEKLSKCSVTIVETKLGQGITKNEDNPANGKVPVYLDDGRKFLCRVENIKIIGFYD